MMFENRSKEFWVTAGFLALSVPVLLVGQTTGLINYPLAVEWGLQESIAQVSAYGVQVNRAFAAGDTFVYIPLLLAALIGLCQKKAWSLLTLAAVGGISAYWSITVGILLVLLEGIPGQALQPNLSYALFIGAYLMFGVWCLYAVVYRQKALLQ